MTELIRRLDPERFAVHVACFRRRPARGCRGSRSARRRSPNFRSAASRVRRRSGSCSTSRVVPAAAHRRGPDVRPLREHLRPARSGAGRRAGPNRQPPRAESRQDRRPDPAPAPGLPLRHDGRRQFAGGARRCSSRKALAAASDCGHPERHRRGRVYRATGVAQLRLPDRATSHHRREPAAREEPRDADCRRRAARRRLPRRAVPDRRRRSAPCGARGAGARSRPRAHRGRFSAIARTSRTLLGAADVFVLPSRSEAFPNGAIEAMAAGLPVVASAVGGLLDLIEPDRTGLLVPAGDADALAAALRRLFSDPALRRTTRRGGADRRCGSATRSNAWSHRSKSSIRRACAARQRAGAHRAQAAGI